MIKKLFADIGVVPHVVHALAVPAFAKSADIAADCVRLVCGMR